MKLLIAGTRLFNHIPPGAGLGDLTDATIICGCARGIDRAGFDQARLWKCPVEFFPAFAHQRTWALARARAWEVIHELPDYDPGDVHAGWMLPQLRNEAMGIACDRAVIVWDGESTGTRHMIEALRRLKKPGILWTVEGVTSRYEHEAGSHV